MLPKKIFYNVKKSNTTQQLTIKPSRQSVAYDLKFESYSVADIYIKEQVIDTCFNIDIKDAAKVNLILEGIFGNNKFFINVGKLGNLAFTSFIASKKSVKLFSQINLQGDGARAYQQVLVLGSGNSQNNLNLVLNHKAQNTFGRLIVRRVQAEGSASSLYGMLNIESTAHGTNSYLSDKVILLGNKSKADSIPSLEIKTNDVQASHSVTIAKLSPEELFYLRSRGLTEDAARALLLKAFIGPVLVDVPNGLKDSTIIKLSQLNTKC
jgi:Fe-S cluster assembly protein SufD